MHALRPVLVLLALAVVAASGCDADCENPQRLDGNYAIWSNVLTHQPPAEELPEEYPVRDLFYNGWSEWTFKYIPAHRLFNLTLDGQVYQASYQSRDDSCNHFQLSFAGIYVTRESGVQNDFSWTGDLMYLGSHLNGTFTYEANWTDPGSGVTGSVSATGEVTGTAVSGARFDTGF